MALTTSSKLPRRLAGLGIIIGFGLMAVWWYVGRYNPFHLPTWERAQSMGNFSTPGLDYLEDVTYALCPGSLLHILTMDYGNLMTYLTWTIAALLNGPLYYFIGLLIVALMKGSKWHRHGVG